MFFYLECAIEWEDIKLMDSITSPLLLSCGVTSAALKIITEQQKGKK